MRIQISDDYTSRPQRIWPGGIYDTILTPEGEAGNTPDDAAWIDSATGPFMLPAKAFEEIELPG